MEIGMLLVFVCKEQYASIDPGNFGSGNSYNEIRMVNEYSIYAG